MENLNSSYALKAEIIEMLIQFQKMCEETIDQAIGYEITLEQIYEKSDELLNKL